MSGGAGFWRKVAGAFVEFEGQRPPPDGGSIDTTLADTDALLRELGAGRGVPAAEPPPPPPVAAPPPGTPIATGVAFGELYTNANVPAVHHTAEQLLAIVDGLAAMPPEAARIAVKAMDDADDRWTLTDVLGDSTRKIDALAAHLSTLAAQGQSAQDRAAQEQAAIASALSEAEATIAQQIAQLQAELQSFQADAAKRRAEVDAEVTATRAAVTAESDRVQAEIARLGRLRTFLDPILSTTTPR